MLCPFPSPHVYDFLKQFPPEKHTERKMTKMRMRTMRMAMSHIFLCCHHILRRSATPVLWKRSAWKRRWSVLSTKFSSRSPRASTCPHSPLNHSLQGPGPSGLLSGEPAAAPLIGCNAAGFSLQPPHMWQENPCGPNRHHLMSRPKEARHDDSSLHAPPPGSAWTCNCLSQCPLMDTQANT